MGTVLFFEGLRGRSTKEFGDERTGSHDGDALERIEDQQVSVPRDQARRPCCQQALKQRVIFGIPTDADGLVWLDESSGEHEKGGEPVDVPLG